MHQDDPNGNAAADFRQRVVEVCLLIVLFFVYAGDEPPMINEAHYLVKAKNFWDPTWCQNDLFASSGKAHTTFYVLFGWPTRLVTLETTAWIGRLVGWAMIAIGLQRLCGLLFQTRFACLAVASIWIAGIEYGNLAGEWVIGGIEAKVPAYALVLLAIGDMVQRKWNRVWLWLGGASAFHVLSGGWSVIAAAIAWWFTERPREDAQRLLTPSLFLGGAIAMFGLVPALALTLNAQGDDAIVAAHIYSYHRIKHHLTPSEFEASWYLRHLVMISITFFCYRLGRGPSQRLQAVSWFTLGAITIAVGGLIVGILPPLLPDLAARLLRFYWFRLTDAIVPLMLGLAIARLLIHNRGVGRVVATGVLLTSVALISASSFYRLRLGVPPSVSNDVLGRDAGAAPKIQQAVFRDWLAVCAWAQASSDPDEIFLTPRHQQTFKWYAQRAEVVNWKDVPQDAASLRQWNSRFEEVYPRYQGKVYLGHIRVSIQYPALRRLRERYGVHYMIVDRRIVGPSLPLVQLYPMAGESNDTYAVYEVPSPEERSGGAP